MSDAVPLPPRPDLDHYRTLARELTHACEAGTVPDWATRWMERLGQRVALDPGPPGGAVARTVERIERLWRHLREKRVLTGCRLAEARLFLARAHGFASWPRFVAHVEDLTSASKTADFEAAVDAIVAGDLEALRRLLRKHRDLVHLRSTREHGSTLLHYVSANGVEDYRQRTPPNIVAIATLLLDAGADVNAESDAYGGHSTTLGLTATSLHPERAGVQEALLALLIARGASLEQRGQAGNGHGAVVGCLANGQGAAARYLAERGAVLDLEGAAGVGRVEVLRQFVDDEGRLQAGATPAQLASGFMYACGYGRHAAVQFLLDRGADPAYRNVAGETPLHWTTFGAHVAVAALLLERGAPADVRDHRHQATPLDWTLFQFAHGYTAAERDRGYGLVTQLIAAGLTPDLGRYDAATRTVLQGDTRLMVILKDAGSGERGTRR